MPANNERTVRNAKNMIIGWCKEYPDRTIATHYRKGYIGCYIKGTDTTINSKGRIYCYGDGTMSLVLEADKEFN